MDILLVFNKTNPNAAFPVLVLTLIGPCSTYYLDGRVGGRGTSGAERGEGTEERRAQKDAGEEETKVVEMTVIPAGQ